MEQQLVTFKHLWPVVRPGGYYVVEDLLTSYAGGSYGGGTPGQPNTFIAFVKTMTDVLNCAHHKEPSLCSGAYPLDVVHLDCSESICLFEKAEV